MARRVEDVKERQNGIKANSDSASLDARHSRQDHLLVILLTGLVAVAWGLVFMVVDILLEYLEPVQVLALRWELAALVMLLLILFKVFPFQCNRKTVGMLLLIGFIQAWFYPLTEVYGLSLTSSSILAIFESLLPCASVVLGALFFGKKTNGMGVLSVLFVLGGVLICTCLAPNFSAGGRLWGYLIIFAGIVGAGLYSQLTARMGSTTNTWTITAMMCFVGAATHTVENFALGYGTETYRIFLHNWPVIGGIAFAAIGSSILCFAGYNKAMALAKNPGLAANVNAGLVTVVGVCAGIFIRHDVAGLYTVVGVVVILLGVWLSSRQV